MGPSVVPPLAFMPPRRFGEMYCAAACCLPRPSHRRYRWHRCRPVASFRRRRSHPVLVISDGDHSARNLKKNQSPEFKVVEILPDRDAETTNLGKSPPRGAAYHARNGGRRTRCNRSPRGEIERTGLVACVKKGLAEGEAVRGTDGGEQVLWGGTNATVLVGYAPPGSRDTESWRSP